jgi:cytoskeletal protein CcmA (bactofilin family)
MFGVKSGKTPQNSIDSLIGAGTRVEGNVVFSGGLRVDGEVRGNISSENGQEGTLVISEMASVEGEISVAHVVINGTVIGPVFASESLELLPAARVTGDVEYHQIEIQQGAVVQGRLVHQVSGGAAKTVELKLASNT